MNNLTFVSKRITNTASRESNPKFSGDQKSIVYEQNNNLFQWNINDGTTFQLTDFKSGKETAESKANTQDQWLEEDQLKTSNILEKRKSEKEARTYRREQTKFERPKTVYTGDKSLYDLNISPDLNYIIYRVYTKPSENSTNVPSYVTESGYTADLRSRPKVGGDQYTYESWILNLKTEEYYQIKTDSIVGIKDKPKFLKEYAENPSDYSDQYENPRPVEISSPVFSEDGKAVVNITSTDNKDRWIMSVNLSDGSLKLIDRQHDDAWIGGPGIGWFSNGIIGWLDNDTVWFKSEKRAFGSFGIRCISRLEMRS